MTDQANKSPKQCRQGHANCTAHPAERRAGPSNIPVSNKPESKEPRQVDLRERFLSHPEEFICVKEAAVIARKSENGIRMAFYEGRLQGVKAIKTIWIWKPGLLMLIKDN